MGLQRTCTKTTRSLAARGTDNVASVHIAEVMTQGVVTAEGSDSLHHVGELMRDRNVGSVVICDARRLDDRDGHGDPRVVAEHAHVSPASAQRGHGIRSSGAGTTTPTGSIRARPRASMRHGRS